MVKFVALLAALLSLPCAAQLTTTDSSLNTGSSTSGTYTAPGSSGPNTVVHPTGQPTKNLWLLYPDPFGVSTGSGTIVQTYTGSGTITEAISLSGIPTSGVDGFPFLLYGCDPFSDCYQDQPPQFPVSLTQWQHVNVDVSWAFTGTSIGSGNIDLLFDEWVCNSSHPTDSSQCLEIEVLPYYAFATGEGGTFQKTFTVPGTVNGTVGTISWDEYIWGSAVLFYPHTVPGPTSAEYAFDLLALLKEGQATFGNSSYQFPSGIELGTEFGDAASQSYTLTLSKVQIQESNGGGPAAPQFLMATVK